MYLRPSVYAYVCRLRVRPHQRNGKYRLLIRNCCITCRELCVMVNSKSDKISVTFDLDILTFDLES